MKSHSKASPQRSCLACRSSRRFSPTRVTPAAARAPISSTGTYFDATRTSTASPAPLAHGLEARPQAFGIDVADELDHRLARTPADQAGLPPRRAPGAAMGEEEVLVAARAKPGILDFAHAGALE